MATKNMKINASLEEWVFIITTTRMHRLFISHISRPKLPLLDYLAELLDCFRFVLLRCLLLLLKLLKKTYMTHLFNFMNNTEFPVTHTKNQGVSLHEAHTHTFNVKSSSTKIGNLQGFTGYHLLLIKRVVYSILRQDARGRLPKGIITRWRVHSSRIGFESGKKGWFPCSCKRMTLSSLIIQKREEIWRWGESEAETTAKARKRSRKQRSQGDTAIRAPTWQDVTCGEQEEETGQI